MDTATNNPKWMATLGMYGLGYQEANVPGLAAQLTAIYRDKVAGIQWLPQGWLPAVLAVHGRGDGILVPAPFQAAFPAPWLDTAEKRAWWNDFAAMVAKAVNKYADGMIAQGRIDMQAAYDRAAFWNTAYNIAMTISAPARFAWDALKSGTLWYYVGGAVLLFFVAPRIIKGMRGAKANPGKRRKRRCNPPYRYLARHVGIDKSNNGIIWKVRYDTDWQEWQVAAFKDGKFQEGPTSYHGGGTNGKHDAIQTFKHLTAQ